MWISAKLAKNVQEDAGSGEIGQVTIGGDRPAVVTRGESRGLSVAAPGGYLWRPAAGDQVLVIPCGEEYVVAGVVSDEAPEENGEVTIKSETGAVIRLKNNGEILLEGDVKVLGTLEINGIPVEVGG